MTEQEQPSEATSSRVARRRVMGVALAAAAILGFLGGYAQSQETAPAEYVVLVTVDGLRRQEVFTGAEEALLNREAGGVRDVDIVRERFWRETPEARREALLPFFWEIVVPSGQLFGDDGSNASPCRVTNGRFFSYPGYHEILCGFPEEAIDSNDKVPNPNVNVLEWLNRRPGYGSRVAAFCSWDVFPYILNVDRSRLLVNAGWTRVTDAAAPYTTESLNALTDDLPHAWESVRYDAITFSAALAHLERHKPRVFYVSLGETDDWAHEGRYDLVLDSAARSDGYLRRLWEFLEADPDYAGRTAVVLTTDHGRGDGPEGWKSHGVDYPGSDQIWVAAWGAGVPALGVRQGVATTQGQAAATVAALLGLDYAASDERIAPPLPLWPKAN